MTRRRNEIPSGDSIERLHSRAYRGCTKSASLVQHVWGVFAIRVITQIVFYRSPTGAAIGSNLQLSRPFHSFPPSVRAAMPFAFNLTADAPKRPSADAEQSIAKKPRVSAPSAASLVVMDSIRKPDRPQRLPTTADLCVCIYKVTDKAGSLLFAWLWPRPCFCCKTKLSRRFVGELPRYRLLPLANPGRVVASIRARDVLRYVRDSLRARSITQPGRRSFSTCATASTISSPTTQAKTRAPSCRLVCGMRGW